jgi:hypothetical protein
MSDSNLLIEPLPPGRKNHQFGDACDRVKDSYQPVDDGDTPYVGHEHLAQVFPAFVGRGKESEVTAIIEYLKEVGEETGFRQVILSHNFDFYRTVAGRLNVRRKHRMFASKSKDAVSLTEEFYQKSPFAHWREGLADDTMLIASIPFLRNLAEFSGDDASFNSLTSLLHVKADTVP